MIANLLLTVYNYLRFSAIMMRLLPPTPIDELALLLGWRGGRKAKLLAAGVKGYCNGDPQAMGICATGLDKLGGICGFTDAPMLALLLARSVGILTHQFNPSGGVPAELSELLTCIRLVLPREHILGPEASHPLRIGRAK